MLEDQRRFACVRVGVTIYVTPQINQIEKNEKDTVGEDTVPKNPIGETECLKSVFIQRCVRTMRILAPLSFVTYPVETFPVLDTSVSWWEDSRVSTSIRIRYQHVRRFMIAVPQDKSWDATCSEIFFRLNICFACRNASREI